METKNNPLLCDPETGVCEIPGMESVTASANLGKGNKPIKIIYYTDPICSSCWGIEPQLRKLKLEYGNVIEWEYRMGGLLPDWSYNSGGISKPTDVAHHWDEVSLYYKMPIDGDVWLEDPLSSSYPPSIAFKAAQLQDTDKAITFLRILREQVFLQKKNITKWEVLEEAAVKAGLDAEMLKTAFDGEARQLFQDDLDLARKSGVRGFPSVFITDGTDKTEFIYGFKPYEVFENGLRKILPDVIKSYYSKDWKSLFDKYPTLTTREYSELSETDWNSAEQELKELLQQSKLSQIVTKNGDLWIRK
jgi:putative protein-disulfide isomerase